MIPGKTNTKQDAIVLLHPGSDFWSRIKITRLLSWVAKTTLPSIRDGVVDISARFPCQYIYTWSFEKVITLDYLLELSQAFPHPKTNCTNAECCQSFYENIGGRITNRASGLLVTAPSQMSNHHHYHEGFNNSATPLFSNIINHLCDEAMQSTTKLGQPFLHTAMKTRGVTEFFNIIDGGLITNGGYTNLISCDRRDHFMKQESNGIKALLWLQTDSQ